MHGSHLRYLPRLLLVLLGCSGHDSHQSGVADRPKPVGLVTYDDDIVVVFRALDCGLFSRSFARVDSIAAAHRLVIRGVMLLGPVMPTEGSRVVSDLGVTFPVALDSLGTWSGLLRAIGTPGPALAVAKQGTVSAIYFGHEAFDSFPFTLRRGI